MASTRMPNAIDRVAREDEAREDGAHDERGGRDDARAVAEALGDGRGGCGAVDVLLAHARDQEDLVVHRESEQDAGDDDRQQGDDRRGLLDAEEVGGEALLEDRDDGAERRPDRQQEAGDRRERHEDGAERDRPPRRSRYLRETDQRSRRSSIAVARPPRRRRFLSLECVETAQGAPIQPIAPPGD